MTTRETSSGAAETGSRNSGVADVHWACGVQEQEVEDRRLDVIAAKRELRQRVRAWRRALPAGERQERDRSIQQSLAAALGAALSGTDVASCGTVPELRTGPGTDVSSEFGAEGSAGGCSRAGTSAAVGRAPAGAGSSGRGGVPAGAAAPVPKPACVALYQPMPGEPGGPDLPEYVLALGYRVLLPRIVAGQAGQLDWVEWTSGGAMERNALGIWEPVGPAVSAGGAAADVVVVPGLALARDGRRLGQGGGFYDRAVGAVAGVRPLLGVVDAEWVLAGVPAEAHDARVGFVVTSEGWAPTGD